MTGKSTKWLKIFVPVEKPVLRIMCFPYAGGAASTFFEWARFFFRHGIEVAAVQLPGRADRMREPVPSSLHELADSILDCTVWESDVPFVFFGHSMGGMLAFEVARRLQSRNMVMPDLLIISASWPPHLSRPSPDGSHMEGNAFLDFFQKNYGALHPAVVANPEMLELVIPVLRLDLALVEGYSTEKAPAVTCPIAVYSGRDDHLAAPDMAASWAGLTTGCFRRRTFSGGHLFLQTSQDALFEALLEDLRGTNPKYCG